MYVFDAELWLWDARRTDTWVFVSVPADVSDEIAELTAGSRGGFGSVPVRVGLGGTTWRTSVFPDAGKGCYVLPVKRAVRVAAGVEVGDIVEITIELVAS